MITHKTAKVFNLSDAPIIGSAIGIGPIIVFLKYYRYWQKLTNAATDNCACTGSKFGARVTISIVIAVSNAKSARQCSCGKAIITYLVLLYGERGLEICCQQFLWATCFLQQEKFKDL